MSIVDGKGLITWEGGLFDPNGVLLPRVRWAFAQIRNAGGSITLNEAGRPYGVPSDQYARNSADTESGRSTVWFQWGRYKRGETPSAANPANGVMASEHTQGIAVDVNAAQPSLRAKYFAMVGLSNTIASESWHWAIRGPVQSGVDLTQYGWAGGNATPIDNENEDDMPDVPTTEAIVRDQSRKLIREDSEYRGALSGLVGETINFQMLYDKTFRGSLSGLVNEAVVPFINAAVAEAVKTVTSADRREERERVVAIKDRPTRWSVNLDTGKVRRYGSPEELNYAVKHQLVSSIQNPDGSWSAENPDIFESDEDLQHFFDLLVAPSNPTTK